MTHLPRLEDVDTSIGRAIINDNVVARQIDSALALKKDNYFYPSVRSITLRTYTPQQTAKLIF